VLDRLGLHSVTLRDTAAGSRDAAGTLPDALAVVSSLVLVAAALYVAWLYLRGHRDRVLACAAAVTAFVAFNKVLSPQYVVWLMPLVPAAGFVVSGVLLPHGSVHHWGEVLSWWILARDLVLVALFVLLVLKLRAGATLRDRR
jgi:hypothetical protein